MFRLLNTIYNDVWLSYTLYDIIKTEIVNHNDVEKNEGKNNDGKNNEVENIDDILAYLNNLILKEEPVLIDIKDGLVLIDIIDDFEKFKLDNSMFQLNFLRTDMIEWKKSKLDYTYEREADWEYINDPINLPCNNYLLYLLENMPENITYKNKNKNGWKRADEFGFEKEACSILNRVKLGEHNEENLWIDDRLLGEKWLGLFCSISVNDTYIEMDIPVPP